MVDKDKEMDESELREMYLRWCMETGSLMSESGYEAFIEWWRRRADFGRVTSWFGDDELED